MKKNLWFAALALAAMTSCSNDEVMDVADNRAIEFKSFVNNGSRAVEDDVTGEFTQFGVFGSFANGSDGKSDWKSVFNNVKVNKNTTWKPEQLAYWEKDKNYNFGAYADGTANAVAQNVSFDAGTHKLTFTNYTAGDKDLVAAIAKEQKWTGGEASAVSLTFNHMLAKVKFTFKTESAETYGLAISNLKITKESGAVKTATGTYDGTNVTWNTKNGQSDDYAYGGITDFATSTGLNEGEFVYMYVIPQSNENLKATFTVTPTNQAGKEQTAVTYTAALKYDTETSWGNGKVYNYTTTINYDKVIEDGGSDKPLPIEFTADVSTWVKDEATQNIQSENLTPKQ